MGVGVRKGNPPKHDPSPEEIAAVCRAIQATWTENERRKRCVYPEQPAAVPAVAIKLLG